MTTSKSLKGAVKAEVKEAQTEAKTGNVKSPVEAARKGDLGPWNEEQARLANTTDLPTNTRRSTPPQ